VAGEMVDGELVILATFLPATFPGIPGSGEHLQYFATEVRCFLELTAGVHLFGTSVSVDRTDVNDDDGYAVFAGAQSRDFLATPVATIERNSPDPFFSNQHIENQWAVQVPVDGLYPFRLVYWQTGHGGNLQWYSIAPDTGDRILVNDPSDARAIKAYRECSAPGANPPYVAEVTPLPGTSSMAAAPPIEALLFNTSSTIVTNSIRLFLNNTLTHATLAANPAGAWRVQYTPAASQILASNGVRLEFSDSTGARHTNAWSFNVQLSIPGFHPVTGQWDFLDSDLRASIGVDLTCFDPDGSGLTRSLTRFGTTTDLGVPDLDGQPVKIMEVPGDLDRRIGYVMTHGIPPNGGGTRVNQYTLIMDIMVDTEGAFAASLLQISDTNNTSDGDLFWQQGNFGQGSGGYNGSNLFTAGEWHRICAAYDEAAQPPVVTKFVDGIKIDDWTANQKLDDVRRALLPKAILFADGDHDERRRMWVSSIQIRSGKLSDADMTALGSPSAEKIPVVIPGTEPPQPPALAIKMANGLVHISWPATAIGYALESTLTLTSPDWAIVSNVTSNAVDIPPTGASQFFRLRK
jgi:hypothetical protein